MANDYPNAGEDAQPEVKEAIERFRQLPEEERAKKPLWAWLLGEGTPDFKASAEDSEYSDMSHMPNHTCGNCESMYFHLGSQKWVCSQIGPHVELPGWCNRWNRSGRWK